MSPKEYPCIICGEPSQAGVYSGGWRIWLCGAHFDAVYAPVASATTQPTFSIGTKKEKE